jgi:para-aminobenzoate synthetase component I
VRKSYSFLPEQDFIPKALQFAERETHVVYLNPNSYQYPYSPFKHVLAFGAYETLSLSPENNFEALKNFLLKHKEWVFGYFSYDLKNEIEELTSNNVDSVQFPLICFFIPKHLIFIGEERIEIQSVENPEGLYKTIQAEKIIPISARTPIIVNQKISREEYIAKIKRLQQHILEGDIYEVNFCMEYFATDVTIHPLSTFHQLNRLSPMPFAAFLKVGNRYLICASPERFLKKEGQKIISQPIKGTAKREADLQKDLESKNSLHHSEKEKAENIMIVDLVRNDLSHNAIPGTVVAEELCAVYTFPSVHQMISTVVGRADTTVHSVDIIRDAFPMGSMTGAPKVKAMKLIEEFEETKRGIFSGAVGYFSPEGDFDFNVVIRSILYNADNKYLSFQAGSAITFYSDAEKEYEECAVKTAAIRNILQP